MFASLRKPSVTELDQVRGPHKIPYNITFEYILTFQVIVCGPCQSKRGRSVDCTYREIDEVAPRLDTR